MEDLKPFRLDALAPKHMAFGSMIRASLQLTIGIGGEKNTITPYTRRGGRPGNLGLPQHIIGRTDLNRRLGIVRHSRAIRTAKLWPVLSRARAEEDEDRRRHEAERDFGDQDSTCSCRHKTTSNLFCRDSRPACSKRLRSQRRPSDAAKAVQRQPVHRFEILR